MLKTIEAVIDEKGNVRLLESVKFSAGRRALVTILDDEETTINENNDFDWVPVIAIATLILAGIGVIKLVLNFFKKKKL